MAQLVDIPSDVEKNLATILKYQQEKSGFYQDPDSFLGEFGDYTESINLNSLIRVIRARIDKSMSVTEASLISTFRDLESSLYEYNEIALMNRADYYGDAAEEADQVINLHKNKTNVTINRLKGNDPLQR